MAGKSTWRMQTLIDGPMGRPVSEEEIADIMRQLRQEEVDFEAAQKARVLAGPLPACLLELAGKTADEIGAILDEAFAELAAEDEDRRAPRPAAPPTETAATDWTADDHRAAFIQLEMNTHVRMDDVIDDPKFKEALDFFVQASRGTIIPIKSYGQLCDAVRRGGFDPKQCIPKRTTETYWNESGNRKNTAWRIFLNMVKLWSKVCCKGVDCKAVSSTKHLLADDLGGFEFDHLHPETKNNGFTIHDEFVRHGLKNIEHAIAMLRDSAVTCRPCHDKGHKAGGIDVGKNN